MPNYGSSNMKGIDRSVREAAREAAREEGLTISEYISRMLMEEESDPSPSVRDEETPRYNREAEEEFVETRRPQPQGRGTFDKLISRLEAVEARSTLALTGIDQSIVGLVARLNKTDEKSDKVARNVSSLVDDLRETHEKLQEKVRAIEEDDTGARNLESLKSLEKALGELATHVRTEHARHDSDARDVRGQLQRGLDAIGTRVAAMEDHVEGKLDANSKKLDEALREAQSLANGAADGLAERVEERLSKLDDFNDRMGAVEGDVAGALTSIEAVMTRMQERLHRAESTTNAALEGLEQTFNKLDARIDDIAKHASPEAAAELRAQFESRFEGLAGDLRETVESARAELAREIEQAAASAAPEKFEALEDQVDGLQKRMAASEERSSRALEGMTNQVSRISSSFDRRLRDVESRDPGDAVETVRADMAKLTQDVAERFDQFDTQNDEVINKITEQMQSLADQFDSRVVESEQRSANAIEQVGEQVANVAQRLQARQERAFNQLKESMDAAGKQQSVRLSDALSGVSDRIDKMQQQQVTSMSPVQKAIASLATRLEALEDFNSPPHAGAEHAEEPDFAPPGFDDFGRDPARELSFDTPAAEEAEADRPLEEPAFADAENDDEIGDIFEIEIDDSDEQELLADAEDDAEFEAGLPDISEVDDESDSQSDEDFLATAGGTPSDESDEIDPLAELSGWDDGADEARDSDIFGEDHSAAKTPDAEDDFDLIAEEESAAEDAPEEEAVALEEDAEAMDYLSRARKAAMAATAESGGRAALGGKSRKGGKTRIPLVAAVSVVALATAAAGTFVTLRGLQQDAGRPVVSGDDTPPQALAEATQTSAAIAETAPAEPEIEPLLESEMAGLSEAELAAIEEELFAGPAEPEAAVPAPAPEPVAAAPAVQFAALPVIPQSPTLESAASSEDPIAQLILGEQRLDSGDYTSGPSLVRKAAEAGLPAAQYRLAKLHERGLGVPKDLAASRQWTERAAQGGNVKAMHDLAVYYAEGEGGGQSYAGAVEWFRRAAEFGLTDSQYNLAVLYEAGLGISPSQTEALYWYEIAHKQGDSGALEKVEALRSRLTLDAAQQAQRRAASWTPSEPAAAANGQFSPQAWQGSAAGQVEAVQTVLSALGYDAGPADGIMGAGTKNALTMYQKDAGLMPTGTITRETVSSLNEAVQMAARQG